MSDLLKNLRKNRDDIQKERDELHDKIRNCSSLEEKFQLEKELIKVNNLYIRNEKSLRDELDK